MAYGPTTDQRWTTLIVRLYTSLLTTIVYAAVTAASETCSRYCDDKNRCTAGFVCPYRVDFQSEKAYCCGRGHVQYCCSLQEKQQIRKSIDTGPDGDTPDVLLIGAIIAAVAIVIVITSLICCFCCPSCPGYKKRHKDETKEVQKNNNGVNQVNGAQVKGHENGVSQVDGTYYYVNKLQPTDLIYHYLDDDKPSYDAGSQLSIAKPFSPLGGSHYSLGQESALSAGHTSLLSTSLSVGQSSLVSSMSTRSQLFRPMSASSAIDNNGFDRGSVISLETNL